MSATSMRMFSSRSRFHRDPKPYYVVEADEGQPEGGRYTEKEYQASADQGEYGGPVYNLARLDPRPEYCFPKYNPSNSVIATWRADIASGTLTVSELLEGWTVDGVSDKAERWHTHQVMSRIENIDWAAWRIPAKGKP